MDLERSGWSGCFGGLSCFNPVKTGKRIVPASRMPEGNGPNGAQAARLTNQAPGLVPSLLAPPSSPASFTNSALQSTAQSPSCVLSLSSPGDPSSAMFATGPYAHETQLVSPPVFSTFTTEPSTAPLTPPPELAHLTTPSSPDVPFAQFLSSANTSDKFGFSMGSQDTNFFCPATFAQFYLDNPPFPHAGGRLSVSKESDPYPNSITRPSKNSRQDAEEIEAYRASFGFSADEIVTTQNYVEISDGFQESLFTVTSFMSSKSAEPEYEGGMEEKRKVVRRGVSTSDTEVDYGRRSRR